MKKTLEGIFSTIEISKEKKGIRVVRKSRKTLWYARENGDFVECQRFLLNFGLIGKKIIVDSLKFARRFKREPDCAYYEKELQSQENSQSPFRDNQIIGNAVGVGIQVPRQASNAGIIFRDKEGSLPNSDFRILFSDCPQRVGKVTDENIKALRQTFNYGMICHKDGDAGRARFIFKNILKLDWTFRPGDECVFNDFGINLRKSKEIAIAIDYFRKGLVICRSDANLYFNLARVHYESGNMNDCVENLLNSLKIEPEHRHSLMFLKYANGKGMIPQRLCVRANRFLVLAIAFVSAFFPAIGNRECAASIDSKSVHALQGNGCGENADVS